MLSSPLVPRRRCGKRLVGAPTKEMTSRAGTRWRRPFRLAAQGQVFSYPEVGRETASSRFRCRR